MRQAIKALPEKLKPSHREGSASIGAAGFEPTTSTTPKWRATKLRYAPAWVTILTQGRRQKEI